MAQIAVAHFTFMGVAEQIVRQTRSPAKHASAQVSTPGPPLSTLS
jgi:hypothetical protein